ncbi:DUF5659 domain-containing protein [Paenibacillus luteus]|uniref:DUF5659 domain-containing protein n=1 Tax=Paenibacillus luteus TaxID=2545753 RepID=UPI0013755AF7|nr:DUF5659 domain-containing protein [Paenibacillus luteus]
MTNAYLYCYSPTMFHFLRAKGIRYICVGVNERSGGRFWLFEKSEEVKSTLDDYNAK